MLIIHSWVKEFSGTKAKILYDAECGDCVVVSRIVRRILESSGWKVVEHQPRPEEDFWPGIHVIAPEPGLLEVEQNAAVDELMRIGLGTLKTDWDPQPPFVGIVFRIGRKPPLTLHRMMRDEVRLRALEREIDHLAKSTEAWRRKKEEHWELMRKQPMGLVNGLPMTYWLDRQDDP